MKWIKKIIRNLLYKPYGIKFFGEGSTILFPRKLLNIKHIEIGNNVFIHKHANLFPITSDHGNNFSPIVKIGHNVYIGQYFHMHAMSKVVIEDGCVISDNVYISGASHGFDPNGGHIMKQPLNFADVEIKMNTFIGRNVFISQGVTLGMHCVVGANSVVTKSFPDYSMIAGSPAKLIKKYDVLNQAWIRVNEKN
ncbi:acyltransferase [Sulfuricurvum sp.]|uniref:acyltransferase n=1 Tax=Sulfuricurvum sp. TaxID=2025608 RepID=UPI002602D183|nr:acyltransferase [Sulfuricurvum sp.]MDD4950726.1 acyltransferase [Sulfuricurvum sp.]